MNGFLQIEKKGLNFNGSPVGEILSCRSGNGGIFHLVVLVQNRPQEITVRVEPENALAIWLRGHQYNGKVGVGSYENFTKWNQMRDQASQAQKNGKVEIKTQMPGKVIAIRCQPGQWVEANETLMILEAMKMENEIRAPYSGEVRQIHVSSGQSLEARSVLVTLQAKEKQI